MNYTQIIEDLMQEFSQHPLDFISQPDFQSRLAAAFRQRLANNNEPRSEFQSSVTGLEDIDSAPDYKSPYPRRIRKKANNQRRPLSRVHTEARIKSLPSWVKGRPEFDILALNKLIKNPIGWNNGVKLFDQEDIEAAIELKFVRNDHYPISGTDFSKIPSAPDSDIRVGLGQQYQPLIQDIRGLTYLPSSTETYMLIFSNYDFLYRGNISDDKQNKQQRYSRVGDIACEVFKDEAQNSGGARICYAYPDGYTWL